MSSVIAHGVVAAPGYASGPLFPIGQSPEVVALHPADPDRERIRLTDALAAAAAAIADLMASAAPDAAEIIEFQQMLLADDSLAAQAYAAIGAGTDAATAWAGVLTVEIAGYEASPDDYFRARAADLADIRDRVLRHLTGGSDLRPQPGSILFGVDLAPSAFLAVDWSRGGGIALSGGSVTSHVAMLARSRGVPMLVGLGRVQAAPGDPALLDAERGRLVVLPGSEERHEYLKASTGYLQLAHAARAALPRPAVTADGARIDMLVNLAHADDVSALDPRHCDGVGLMRTEFLFADGLPDEEQQYTQYRRILEWAADRPVTIRTLDAGGDKPVPGLTVPEANPFLGLRGIRLSLSHPDVFRTQIRALLRAAPHGELRVMFPMIASIAEYRAARALFEAECLALRTAGTACRLPPLGIMVEVPAVAIHPQPFAEVAFLSIGSNDLTQYVMAAGRDNGAVAGLADPAHPAVLKLIADTVRFGDAHGIPVSLCGDAAGEPAQIPRLLATGLRSLSVAPAQLAFAKAAVIRAPAAGGEDG
ncbi:MAG: phosphoenolpyruvate--protein phosphotransferase [Devosia sp.]|nr:phosphoenolpyruvate--protein phosphotransferase [Devosia sp.]